MPNPGQFIVLEGLEGAGKSTALTTIKRYLVDQGIDVMTTREPGGTHVGEIARQLIKASLPSEPLDARAELLLFYAARVQLIERVIRPALQRGCWVLADRFELSTFAYQGGGRKLDDAMLKHLSAFCVTDLKPNLTIFLDVQPELGLQRAVKRGKLDRIEQESVIFFRDVYNSYQHQIKAMNNVIKIDANFPLPHVQSSLRMALQNYLKEYASSTTN